MPTSQQMASHPNSPVGRIKLGGKPGPGNLSPTEASTINSPASGAGSSRENSFSGGGWQAPTLLMVRRGKDLGITCEDHSGPGVRVASLNPNDLCASAGMLEGSALISVSGTKVKSHAHAIELMVTESKRVLEGFSPAVDAFEVVVRELSSPAKKVVVQSL